MKLLSYILLFFSIQMHSQEFVNQYNEKGEREGVWKKYYPNKKIRYQGEFKDGKEIGTFKFYSINTSAHPIAIKKHKKNSNITEVSFFTEKGVLQSKGNMIGKQREGTWNYYRKDGQTIITTEFYKKGLLEGQQKIFYKNGKLAKKQHYKAGKLYGKSKKYTNKGILLEEVNYKNGKLHGTAKYFNLKGKLMSAGTYQNGKKVGNWQYNFTNDRKNKNN